MSDYAPTRQHVRAVWLDAYPDEFRGQGGAAFDRFIAALRAEWEAEQSRADAVTSVSAYDDGHTEGFAEGRAAALAEQGEVEWEYNIAYPRDGEWDPDGVEPFDSRQDAMDELESGGYLSSDRIVRRRKAGPWVPVNENGSER